MHLFFIVISIAITLQFWRNLTPNMRLSNMKKPKNAFYKLTQLTFTDAGGVLNAREILPNVADTLVAKKSGVCCAPGAR